MRNFRYAFTFLALLSSFTFAACEDDEDDKQDHLTTTAVSTTTSGDSASNSSSQTSTASDSTLTTTTETDTTATADPLQQALDGLVASEVVEQNMLGMAMTVELADGKLLHAQSGKIGPNPGDAAYMHNQTKQVMGSITKLFTAVMILQLVEEKRITLDDPVSTWLDLPKGDQITIRMLLNHTSGLNDYLALIAREQLAMQWQPQALIDLAVQAGARTDPGAPLAWYSNTNFIVLGVILERVTGSSWADNLAPRITNRLGLAHTFYAGDISGAMDFVEGWSFEDGVWNPTHAAVDASVGWAAGAIVSTNEEIAKFTSGLLNGTLFAEQATLAAMLDFNTQMDPATLGEGEPPQSVGLGMTRYEIDDVHLVGHMGHIYGYDAATFRDPVTGAIFTASANTEQALTAWSVYKAAVYLRQAMRSVRLSPGRMSGRKWVWPLRLITGIGGLCRNGCERSIWG